MVRDRFSNEAVFFIGTKYEKGAKSTKYEKRENHISFLTLFVFRTFRKLSYFVPINRREEVKSRKQITSRSYFP